jgi:hypothetical protein
MSIHESTPGAAAPDQSSYIRWTPIIAGAVTAAALAFVLHGFAGAVGLAVSSASPTWRDASMALWVLSGVYLIVVALASYGLGGYIAGRMRVPFRDWSVDDVDTRDGAHGLLVWALATLLTGVMIALAASVSTQLAAPSGGSPGAATSVAGENIVAFDIDRLLRTERRAPEADLTYNRAEAARILLTSSGHSGVNVDDRAYLIRLVAARTGLAPGDAERRVDIALSSARENIARGRRSSVILAFMASAAGLLGAAAAWFAACAGGRHRDSETAPSLYWSNKRL